MKILKFISLLLCFVFVTSQTGNNTSLDDLISNVFNQSNNNNNVINGIAITFPPQVQTTTTAIPRPLPPVTPSMIDVNNGVVLAGCGLGYDCVAYYLCKNDSILKTGEGLLDIRFDGDTPKQCPFLETCCAIESQTDTPVILPKPTPDGCGYRNSDGIGFKITGDRDNETEYGEFPWMVAILKEEKGLNQTLNIYECGGSIIHPRVVLTAAHCVQNKPASILKARAGEWDTQTKREMFPDQDRDVAEVIVHEHYYKGALYNDIALLILTEPFDFTENVKSICLPPPETQFDYQRCLATGWGKDSFGQMGKYQVILKKIDLPVVPRDQCQNTLRTTRLGKYFELHPSFICAGGERGKDTCKGDGGSPLVCPIAGTKDRYYQAGIVAWGIGCGDEVPGVYASVAKLRPWIDEQLAYKRIDSAPFTP